MMKEYIKKSFIVSVIIAAIFTFIQDFIYFDYSHPGVIFSHEQEKELDNMMHKDVLKYIDNNTKEYSIFEGMKYILSRYRYSSTWVFKIKTLTVYFFAVFIGCMIMRSKLIDD